MLALPAVLTHLEALQVARNLAVQIQAPAKAQATSLPIELVLDASALAQFDSSALAVILACRREAAAVGKTFSVHGLPARLSQLAGLYGVSELIPQAV
jgi:phospholipid transport system transporter-binding protein